MLAGDDVGSITVGPIKTTKRSYITAFRDSPCRDCSVSSGASAERSQVASQSSSHTLLSAAGHFRCHAITLASLSSIAGGQLWLSVSAIWQPTEQAQLFGKLGWLVLRALATVMGFYSSLVARTRAIKVHQALLERGIDTDAAEAAVWKQITAAAAAAAMSAGGPTRVTTRVVVAEPAPPQAIPPGPPEAAAKARLPSLAPPSVNYPAMDIVQ